MTFHFVPGASFIAVAVEIVGPLRRGKCVFALDTGATRTVVDSGLLNLIGLGPASAVRQQSANIVGGQLQLNLHRLACLTALGVDSLNHLVAGTALNNRRFDGLLGKDFFRDRVLKIDFRHGTIDVT